MISAFCEDLLLIPGVLAPITPVALNMAAAPKSFTALLLPANGAIPRFEKLEVKEDNTGYTAPTVSTWTDILVRENLLEDAALQPAICLAPKVPERFWNTEAWNKRDVVACSWKEGYTYGEYQVLYTRSEIGLKRNPHVEYIVSGDVFVLKARDQGGQMIFMDLDPDTVQKETLEDIINMSSDALENAKEYVEVRR